MKKRELRTYQLVKYVQACSAGEAIKKDKLSPVIEVNLQEIIDYSPVVGFDMTGKDSDEESIWKDDIRTNRKKAKR